MAKSIYPGTLVAVNGRAYRPCGECGECMKTVGNEQDTVSLSTCDAVLAA